MLSNMIWNKPDISGFCGGCDFAESNKLYPGDSINCKQLKTRLKLIQAERVIVGRCDVAQKNGIPMLRTVDGRLVR